MSQKHIAIIRGGPSDEYALNLEYGSYVLESLREMDHILHDVVVLKNGEWLVEGFVKQPSQVLSHIDAAFLCLRGDYGEGGKVQRTLERFGVPYTGSSSYSSAIALNKVLAKAYVRELGIKTAPHMQLNRDAVHDTELSAQSIASFFGPSYVVKPLRGSTKNSVTYAYSHSELALAIKTLFDSYSEIIVEEMLHGIEVTVGLVENFRNRPYYTFPTIEVNYCSPSDQVSNRITLSKYICPARLSHAQKAEIESTAISIHDALQLRHFSRSDFMLTHDGLYFLEANTLPDLGVASPFMPAFESVGTKNSEIIRHLVNLSLGQ